MADKKSDDPTKINLETALSYFSSISRVYISVNRVCDCA
jgi:hypothetical protein